MMNLPSIFDRSLAALILSPEALRKHGKEDKGSEQHEMNAPLQARRPPRDHREDAYRHGQDEQDDLRPAQPQRQGSFKPGTRPPRSPGTRFSRGRRRR